MDYEKDEDFSEGSMVINAVMDNLRPFTSSCRQSKSLVCFPTVFTDIIALIFESDLPIKLGIKVKMIGSTEEGLSMFTLLNGASSDLDVMVILQNCEAYEHCDVSVFQGHCQFQLEPCDRNPGYVKLKVIQEETENGILELILQKSFQSLFENESSLNICYLSSELPATMETFFGKFTSLSPMTTQLWQELKIFMEPLLTGPSMSLVDKNGVVEKFDFVISIPCPNWPTVAREWVVRERHYGWPSQEFISEHEKRGCYVVPVGCKECDRTDLDWRLSFTHVEQALIKDFNVTQFRCLLLLKQLKTFFFHRQIGDIVSSYILKTTVFWVIEESPRDLWVPHQLLKTVQKCLDKLISFIQQNFCPNYFIRTSNLLAKRYTREEQPTVLQVCDFVRGNIREKLYQTPPFASHSSVWNMIVSKKKEEEILKETGSPQNVLVGMIHCVNCIIMRSILSCQQTLTAASKQCERLYHRLNENMSKHHLPQQKTRQVTKQFELMCRRLDWTDNYLKATNNKCRYQCMRMLQDQFTEMNDLVESVTNCHLHTAVGNYTLTNEALKVLISKHKCLPQERTCFRSFPSFNSGLCLKIIGFVSKFLDINDSNLQLFLSSPDILFLRVEKDFLPLPIQMEMLPNQKHVQDVLHDLLSAVTTCTVAVDPLVYACFLRFWCCVKLEQNTEMLKARDDMVWCCSLPDITNKAVAFNLLGYCHKHLEEYEEAFRAFCTALKQDHQSNATFVHISILVNSIIRRESNETYTE